MAAPSSPGIDRTTSLGGFIPDRFVAGSFNDNLLCAICRYVFDSPVLTPCGHLFCASCLSHWLTACQTLLPSCPECRRTVFAFDVRPVRGLRNYIASLPTYCSLRRHGCNTVLPLEQIQAHEDVCTHKTSPPNISHNNSSGGSSNESSPNNSVNSRTSRTRVKQQLPPSSSNQRQITSSSNNSSRNGTANFRNVVPSSPGISRSRTAGALAVHVNNSSTRPTVNSSSSHLHPTATVIDHRPNARQRIAIANSNSSQLQNNSSQQHSLSLNDRVARLEEKLQQVRLDIEAAEQRNVWLETQLALARNNLSLADALRRVRATPSSSSGNTSGGSMTQSSVVNRRRPATQALSPIDD